MAGSAAPRRSDMNHRVLACVALGLLGPSIAVADELKAAPGEGTISVVASKAAKGDTIVLEEGQYRDSITLPAGVTLRGAGAGKTILLPKGYAAINCQGAEVTVCGLT